MADDIDLDEGVDTPPRKRKRRWAKRAGWLLAILVTPILLVTAFLSSPIGKRYVADQIAAVAPASGLRFEIGRIEGDLYGESVLHDVRVLDPKGVFLTIPELELNWRPLAWFTSGIDVRNLVARRATLTRMPELLPGDPDAPILPDFDIRVDRFEIDNLTLAPGLVGDEAQRVDLLAEADIRSGRVFVKADGTLGSEDTLALLVDAEPDGDRFDLALDYKAPLGGAIASLLGAEAGYRARIDGDGTWSQWTGHALVQRDGARFAAFRVTNRAGQYGIIGQASPGGIVEGMLADALGRTVSLAANGTLEDSVLDGDVTWRTAALAGQGEGVVDLAGNRFDDFDVRASLVDPQFFGPDLVLQNTRASATLDGAFRDLSIEHVLTIGEMAAGETQVLGLVQQGDARFDGSRWTLPLNTKVDRIVSGNEWVDPRLVDGTLSGTVNYSGSRLFSEQLALAFPGLDARLALRGDTARGGYALAGPVDVRGLALDNVGTANARAKIVFKIGAGVPWTLRADLDGRVDDVSNATLANLAGDPIRIAGGIGIGAEAPLTFRDISVDAEKLQMTLDGQVEEGRTTLAGAGTHTQYGDFTVEAALAESGPEAVLVFANPYPAAGLSDVRVALSPSEDGFRIETTGESLLGRFDGLLGLVSPAEGPTTIDVERLRVWKTDVTGNLALEEAGVRGTLSLAGGGLDGSVVLAPRDGGQSFQVDLDARNATFGGDTRIALAEADIEARGFLIEGNSRITADVTGQGLTYGSIFIGRLAANAQIVNGRGDVNASIAGRRGSRFNLQLASSIAPERITAIARGSFAGRPIAMPRRAVLAKQADGGWRLAPTQVGYAGGMAIASGEFGGGTSAVGLKLDDMPLSLVDVVVADLGLGGTISGVVDFNAVAGQSPTGTARVKVANLTRSGLVLSSRPVDLALVGRLGPERLSLRAIVDDDGTRLGRLQGRVTNFGGEGPLVERLRRGNLFAQLRYDGAADALWRLAAIDAFDLTGPVALAADVTGTLADPRVRGSVSSNALRVQSSLSGTDIRNVAASGTFDGSRLRITRFAGEAPNGGTITGSGTVDLADMRAGRGPALDLRASASNARLLNANGLSATVTGPLRIVSSGNGGTIAGRLRVDRASWRLGTSADDVRLPNITTREINVPPDIAPVSALGAPWRYLIDAQASSRIDVDGMGLDSEWGADIILRGTTDDPRIGGEARVVRGAYSFAGTRFELTRGRIDFDERVPIDPRIDIEAETDKDGLSVIVNVSGNAQQPEIAFSSEPALPEEELLSRLLFGDSITSLSATDALQLGAALASLRGGGGLDPINQLRSAIGLDRLRIVGADPALDRGTGVALGKNIGQRFYVEIITDGRGYSATEVEFRITSWLALLGSVSTIGRESVVAEISRDY